jgi:hypothetical protein
MEAAGQSPVRPHDKTFKTIIVPGDIAGLWRAYQAMSGLTFIRFNRTNNENGIAATLLEGDARQVTMLIAVVLLTVVTAVVIRSRLGRQYGAELAERSRTATVSRTA